MIFKQLLRSRLTAAILMAAVPVTLALALEVGGPRVPAGFPALEDLPAMGQEAAEAALLGRAREEILNAWGQPDGGLSGLFGDIYTLENGSHVIVYYDPEPMNQGIADANTVPVQFINVPSPDREEAAL